METFSWNVSLNSSKETKARVLKTQYGDGYSQRVRDGINSLVRAFPVTIKASSLATADQIEGFLEARNGDEAFAWTPPHAAAAIKVTCDSWRRQDRVASSVITATFQQVF
ncbi:MAG: hypothetical protein A2075_12225 [Geobacteraceae bacterium GWC2_58_44]|nr:MAG: hypothetical protein A2075_12225 [Geobacteraceae bacterium GWC2_58_44]HBG06329.1 phage tail protein [Geobacter sp.]